MTPLVLQMTWSGAFSAFSAISWNGRSVWADDPVLAYKKMGVVRAAANEHVHALLQELGGTELCAADFISKFKVSHFVGVSAGSRAARRVASLHAKRVFFSHESARVSVAG